MKSKYIPIIGILATFILFFAIAVFRPRTVLDTLNFQNVEMSETAYCSLFDVTQLSSAHWSEPSTELLGSSNQIFAPVLHQVRISGPISYKNVAINAELVNLYFSIPQENGTFQNATVELIVSHSGSADKCSVFINIENRGYFVISGKNNILSFIDAVREKNG